MISAIRNRLGVKPHICKLHHWWRCFNAGAKGEGSTPQEAYRQWLKAWRKSRQYQSRNY